MGSILQTTLNTRALSTGNFRYVRSDYPGKLTDEDSIAEASRIIHEVVGAELKRLDK